MIQIIRGFLCMSVLSVFSCQKIKEYSYLESSELEMVVTLNGESIDTLQTSFGARYTMDFSFEEGQFSYTFYRDDLKIRSLVGYDRDSHYSIVQGDFRQDIYSAYSNYDSLNYVIWKKNNVYIFKEYSCILNYPFDGINCFKRSNQ